MKKSILTLLSLFLVSCVNQPLNSGNLPSVSPSVSASPSSLPQVSLTPSVSATPTNIPVASTSSVNPEISSLPTSTPFATAIPTPSPSITPISYEGAIQLNTVETISNSFQLLGMNNQGKAVLVYSKTRIGESQASGNGERLRQTFHDVYIRTFDSSGKPLINELKIKENITPAKIVMDNNGDFVLLYTAGVLVPGNIYVRKYDINGNPLTDEILISEYTVNNENSNMSLNVVPTSGGGFLISWVSAKNNPFPNADNVYKPYESLEVVTRQFDTSLKPVSVEKRNKISNQYTRVGMSAVIDKDDNYYISTNSLDKIGLLKLDKNGSLLFEKTDFIANNTDLASTSLIIDNEGNLVVSWLKKYDFYAVYLRKYSSQLNTFKEQRVSLDEFSTGTNIPAVTIDSRNNITVGWIGTDRPSGNSNVLIRKYDNNLNPLNKETLINKLPGSSGSIILKTDKDDNSYIFFRTQENVNYLKKFNKAGNLIQ